MKPPTGGFYLIITLFFFTLFTGCDTSNKQFIAVNVEGYEIGSPKQAFLVNTKAEFFQLVRTENSEVVLTGKIGLPAESDSASGDRLSAIDFSIFNNPGEYKIQTMGPGKVTSHPFHIGENVYNNALLTMVKSYYYHRCGTRVDVGTEWNYETCHLDDAPFYSESESSKKSVTGGWHDAGDYNKFSGNTALSASLLLYAYESKPQNFRDNQLGIPESGNGTPDILDEVSWALEWLLKMQREDGAVYHKVSQEKWIGEYLPTEDPSTRYLFDVSSAATASFVAASALGARHLAEYNPGLSFELSLAAEKAWRYLEEHTENIPMGGFENPEGVSGGEYGDPNDLDERLWAAMELYRLTNNGNYLTFFIDNYEEIITHTISPLSWRDAESLAFHAFLSAEIPDKNGKDVEVIWEKTIRHADTILNVHRQNNYRNLNRPDQYYWGSNSVGLAYAFDLMQAYNLTNDLEFKYAALDQLHYVLGRNPFNLSQVTGVGSAAVKNPYHQLSEIGGFSSPVPGMLVGGPNNHLLLNDKEISSLPGKNYEDTFANYLVNEPAINFTAILVYVTNFFSTAQSQSNDLTTSK
ncbi:MAG: glycoside hydrolase family 9 protein [Balneolaceae bacterium]